MNEDVQTKEVTNLMTGLSHGLLSDVVSSGAVCQCARTACGWLIPPGYFAGGINTPSQKLKSKERRWIVGNDWADPLVMLDWVMLCVVISQVSVSGSPVNMELLLVHAILDPVESHIHGARSDLSHSAISDARGSGIIDLYRCWGLRMS
jgi:hypothetical protein